MIEARQRPFGTFLTANRQPARDIKNPTAQENS
jgi:hypothetical protein